MTPEGLLARVVALVPGATALPLAALRGQAVVTLGRDGLGEAFRTLRQHEDLAFDQLLDVTAVDYLGRTPRFEVVYQLHALAHRHRLRVKVAVEEADAVVPSATPVWKSALWAEREVFDLFGVRFDGHPDLRRILMYPGFEGHPLRKDYPLMQRQPLVPERDPLVTPWFPRRPEAGDA
jgi:NADH-quinone oxidoreductase subunit C